MKTNRPILGSHVSFSGPDYMLGSVKDTLSYSANAMMIYLGSPQTTIRPKNIDYKAIEAYKLLESANIPLENIIVHAPYICNLASPDDNKRIFAKDFLDAEMSRAESLNLKVMVLHPGSAVGQSFETAAKNVTDCLNEILPKHPNVTIALETMAGKGTEIGRSLDEIKSLLDLISSPNIGVCLDTCHIFSAGYDIVNDMSDFDSFINLLQTKFDINLVKCIHLNDSLNPIGAHKDRHANIGKGYIGFESLKKILYNDKFESIPKILETPYIDGKAPYKDEIELLTK